MLLDCYWIAIVEPGCLFFFLFHTAFVDNSGELSMQIGADENNGGVDKAFKKVGQPGKIGKYHADGRLVLKAVASAV